jgi:hypothetical protein
MRRNKYIFSGTVITLLIVLVLLFTIIAVSCKGANSKEVTASTSGLETVNGSKPEGANSNIGLEENKKNKILENGSESDCAAPETVQAESDVNGSGKLSGEKVIKDINEMLMQQVPPFNALLFLDRNISLLEGKDADMAIDSVEKLLIIYQVKYSEMLSADEGQDYQKQLNDFVAGYGTISNGEITMEQAAHIWDKELSNLLDEIFKSGFKLVNFEGIWFAVIDYGRVLPYNSYLSEDYAASISFKAVESDKIYLKDAALKITWDEISARLLNAEDFLIRYPESEKYFEMAGKYYDYLAAYIIGTNNTPSFDYDTNKFKPEVLESYKNMVNNNKFAGFFTVFLVKNLIKAIEENSYLMNGAVRDFIKKSNQEAEQYFGVKDPYV